MGGILDFFKTPAAATPPQTQQAPTNQQQQTTPTNLGDAGATTNGNNQMPGTGVTPVNPLDEYKKVMENAAKNSEAQAPQFKLDSKVLSEVSTKMDFTQGVSPDLMQKALSGDAQSLLQVIQATSQNAYKSALEHGSALTDTFLTQRSSYEAAKINQGVRSQLTEQNLSSTPNYDHPVIKQELNRVADQFAKANPDLPPAEIAKAAQKYITDLASALNPSTAPDPSKPKEGETDWSKYFN